jgi:high-affinity iron transporter
MGKNVFSVPIFFIVFRETLEAAIIVSVLCSLVEQIARDDKRSPNATVVDGVNEKEGSPQPTSDALAAQPELEGPEDAERRVKRFIRRMRIQIFAGSFVGFFIALAVGAAFIAVWFTKASDLWSKSEELWEGKLAYRPVLRRANAES